MVSKRCVKSLYPIFKDMFKKLLGDKYTKLINKDAIDGSCLTHEKYVCRVVKGPTIPGTDKSDGIYAIATFSLEFSDKNIENISICDSCKRNKSGADEKCLWVMCKHNKDSLEDYYQKGKA